jgi:hypothetical protein
MHLAAEASTAGASVLSRSQLTKAARRSFGGGAFWSGVCFLKQPLMKAVHCELGRQRVVSLDWTGYQRYGVSVVGLSNCSWVTYSASGSLSVAEKELIDGPWNLLDLCARICVKSSSHEPSVARFSVIPSLSLRTTPTRSLRHWQAPIFFWA